MTATGTPDPSTGKAAADEVTRSARSSAPSGPGGRTALRICPLCEATCGLTLTIGDGRITGARGDREDVFSHGFICPKGASFGELDADPDRLRRPLVRDADGNLQGGELGGGVRGGRRRDSAPSSPTAAPTRSASYLGNPNVHTMAGALYPPLLARRPAHPQLLHRQHARPDAQARLQRPALRRSAAPSPSPTSTAPTICCSSAPTPWSPTASCATAPDFPGRLKALKRARRHASPSSTPAAPVPPSSPTGTWPSAPAPTRCCSRRWCRCSSRRASRTRHARRAGHGRRRSTGRASRSSHPRPSRTPATCRPRTIRTLARELAAAPTAAVYGRVGSCTVEFGTLASWLVDVAQRPHRQPRPARRRPLPALRHRRAHRGRRAERAARASPSAAGTAGSAATRRPRANCPSPRSPRRSTTPGEGRSARCIAIAAQPRALRTRRRPSRHGRWLELDFMVSVDPYLNETTRHADVVLPPPAARRRAAHFDFAFNALRRTQPGPLHPRRRPAGGGRAWPRARSMARLVLAATGMHGADPAAVDEAWSSDGPSPRPSPTPHSPVHGRDPEELAARLDGPRAARSGAST